MSEDPSDYLASSSPIDSALLFVVAAFTLNVVVVVLAFCYFDPSSDAPLSTRIATAFRRKFGGPGGGGEAQVFFV